MYLCFPDCNSDDYIYLHRLFLKQGEVSAWRRFFPVIHSTWHLDGLVEAMKTEKRDLIKAGLLQNPRWMNRDLSKLFQVYFELEKVDKDAAESLLATMKEGCNTNAFVTAYLRAQTKEEKDLIKTCFQGSTRSRFSNVIMKALSSGNANELGQALCYEIVHKCRKEMISLLLEKGANVNQLFQSFSEDLYGCTPLMLAIYKNQTEIATLLLQQPNLNVNYVDPCGNTALMYGIGQGNQQVVSELLNNPLTDVNRANNRYSGRGAFYGIRGGVVVAIGTGTSPLIHAVTRATRPQGKIILSLLLQHQNIDVNYASSSGQRALAIAIETGNIAIVAQLLKEAPNLDVVAGGINSIYPRPDRNKDIYSMLMERYSIDKAFIWAIKEKRMHDVKRFFPYVDTEYECPTTGDTPLIAALRSNCIEAVELLIPLVDVNKLHSRERKHPLNYANKVGKQALFLSPYPLTFTDTEDHPFYHCIQGKEDELRSWLVRNPKKINALDEHGNALLHYAAAKGHVRLVSLLLKQPGINLNLKNDKGDIPLHIAIRNGQEEVIKLLILNKKTDLNATNVAGDSLLSLAVRLGKENIAIELLKRGVEIDPLAIAMSIESPLMFETLIKEPKRRRDLIMRNICT